MEPGELEYSALYYALQMFLEWYTVPSILTAIVNFLILIRVRDMKVNQLLRPTHVCFVRGVLLDEISLGAQHMMGRKYYYKNGRINQKRESTITATMVLVVITSIEVIYLLPTCFLSTWVGIAQILGLDQSKNELFALIANLSLVSLNFPVLDGVSQFFFYFACVPRFREAIKGLFLQKRDNF